MVKGRLTLTVPEDVIKEAKKKIENISAFVTEQLLMEIYRDSPSFIRKKVETLEKNHGRERDLLLAQLKVAEEKQKVKKERLEKFKPEGRRRYGAIIGEDE